MALLEIDDKVYKIPNRVMKAFEDMSDYIKELKEKNKTFEDYNKDLNNQLDKLQQRIDKAIKYIGSITDVKVRYFNYREFEKKGLHISHEELKKRIKEQKLEGFFIEIDRDDILKILKGEEK